ncbi:hypothetical protein [Mesorhizobium sp.]|jgi:hypothetical protein|uniref:hypothetical protein n=1 Tax=Mesorhizobium sp. TaxID=1871066 RepID=UPI000FE770FC|nr:hypothetical protein [Mesorhizobium sp.]RWB04270.1 MAG: hypothetical protein EOQ33_11965 [Mesorhizobium sp.]RWO76036.1 MAG: hypothetical protein EOQ95_32410 [Mesorhizobium sp.]RWP19920.1 MAG: hypothetical protein EOR00_06615 [Mesorhizobium sp.]RWP22642.1 MAG: hypothetical protein EOR01_13140 [Mesorhizobium sp.]RWP94114.1 MAG: hypothetical protein EOR89_31785 [Mesorhizobium sp.]
MTPEFFGSWLLQVAVMLCVVAGLAMTIVAVRTGWSSIGFVMIGFARRGRHEYMRSVSSMVEKILTTYLREKGYLPKGAAE